MPLDDLGERGGVQVPVREDEIGAGQEHRSTIHHLLATGTGSVEHVAELFRVHRCALNRCLARHGTSFEALLDDTRRDLAEQLLGATDLPMADIATMLGCSNQGNFTRAFKRWHNRTPSR